MSKFDICNTICNVSIKMELMQTILEVLLDMVDEKVESHDDAIAYASQRFSMNHLVRVLIDYNFDGKEMLDQLQEKIG